MKALSVHQKKTPLFTWPETQDSEEGASWKHFEDRGCQKAIRSQPFILTGHGSVGVVFTA